MVLNLFGVLPANKKKLGFRYDTITAYLYTSIHSTTRFSPFFLVFGRKPRLIGDALLDISFSVQKTATSKDYLTNLQLAHQMCRERLVKERVRFKNNNKHRSLVLLEEGGIVLIRNFNLITKIDNQWHDSLDVVVSQPDNDIPVYVVKKIASG